MQEITQYAQKLGILVIWDLSHSTGAVPIDLNQSNADFAVGCGYKYLNGGPGAPSFMYVAERHLAAFQQPLTGWFGHANPFAMSDQYQAAQGIKSAQCGTPSVLASIALEEGLTLFKDISLDVLRDKSIRLCELFLTLSEEKLGKFEMELISPREAELRGSHISLAHPHGYAIMQALIARGVIGDFRAPDILRFGFAPLYVSFCDVYKAVAIIEEVMLSEHWRKPEYQIRAKVT
jgi:kynureninase